MRRARRRSTGLMSRLSGLGSQRRLRLVVGLLALGALFGLDAIYVMHYAAEAACEGVETGDPYDCFICANLFTMGLDLPAVAVVPTPEAGHTLAPPDDITVAVHILTHRTGARSPPAESTV